MRAACSQKLVSFEFPQQHSDMEHYREIIGSVPTRAREVKKSNVQSNIV